MNICKYRQTLCQAHTQTHSHTAHKQHMNSNKNPYFIMRDIIFENGMGKKRREKNNIIRINSLVLYFNTFYKRIYIFVGISR